MPYYERAELIANFSDQMCCAKCQVVFGQKNALFECFVCKKCYHPSCKMIFGAHIKRLAENQSWVCSTECEVSLNINGEDISPKSDQPINSGNKLDQLLQKMNQMSAEFGEVKVLLAEVKGSQDFISDKFDKLNEDYIKIVEQYGNLSQEVDLLKENYQQLQYKFNLLEASSDKSHQLQLKNNIIIAGLPNNTSNPVTVVKAVCNSLGINVSDDHMLSVEYLPQKTHMQKSQNTSVKNEFKILMKLSPEVKQNILQSKSKKKYLAAGEIGFVAEGERDRPIFLRDQLTSYQMQLYWETQQLQKILKFQYLWVKNGMILFRKQENTKVYKIDSRNDITKLEKKFGVTRHSQ